ncbi:MAG: hypothetical protein KY464_05695 [Gemmatimonadetes bacterium]|nr:hypothetical protein [Gemmatimonadota bacterium]
MPKKPLFSPSWLGVLVILLLLSGARLAAQQPTAPRWWKGNLHTHSLWSDGDEFPEMIAEWYKRNGYNFLAFTEHNAIASGSQWVALRAATDTAATRARQQARSSIAALPAYLARFGSSWVEQRRRPDGEFVRLKPFSEFRTLFDEPGRFLLINGEEITNDSVIHINAIHLQRLIEPQPGPSVLEIIQKNVDAVLAQRRETGQPMFPFINHPNFRWAITAEEISRVRGVSFFEVYNGHLDVNNEGDAQRAGTERMWDIILTLWHAAGRREPIFGLGTDDAHHYRPESSKVARPGRGWIVVRAAHLTPESLVTAIEAGEFYSSTGVVLRDVRRDEQKITVEIEPEAGVSFVTQFIGTRKGYDAAGTPVIDAEGKPVRTTRRYEDEIGEVLQEVRGTSASYTFRGDEVYVRAKVVSSKPKQDPTSDAALGFERAWTQPFLGAP